VARPSEWRSPDDPHLLLMPGQTNLTNVLAFVAVHFHWAGAVLFLMRRRSYEEEALEWESLGSGPVTLTVELLPE
jgi:hypothetical protein